MTSLAKKLPLFLLLLWLSGCSLFDSQGQETGTPALSPTSITPTPTPYSTLGIGFPTLPTSSTPRPTTPEPEVTELVMWTTEDYAPNSETPGGLVLMDQIGAFQQSKPNVDVDVIVKKKSGPGGLLDFLTTASVAAPTVLPDVVILSIPDLRQASQAGLIYPLDDLISAELLADRFDFAASLTQVDGQAMGILYRADLQHLVYDANLLQDPPNSWFNIYHSGTSFVFSPATLKDGVNDVILIQYLGAEGELVDEQGQIALDKLALSRALRFFEQAHDDGVVSAAILILNEDHSAWSEFRNGNAGIVQVPASLYLADRDQYLWADFSPVPVFAPETSPNSVGHGWALCLATTDPQRQRLAVDLIEHLLAPENSGAWTQTVGYLPTRRAALDVWNADDPYVPFVRELLEKAAPAPPPDVAERIGPPLTTVLRDVLTGAALPAEAAEEAVNAVQEGGP